ncbi:MAG: DUF6228 family protein [Actinomycetota bacterium]|nr:DUF6228 family protein [Actinomycetota bacterium]
MSGGSSLAVRRFQDPNLGSREPGYDEYGFVDFRVAITGGGLDAESSVQTMEDGLPNLRSFFRDLAADWRGLNGDSTWEAIEHDLTIETIGRVTDACLLRSSGGPAARRSSHPGLDGPSVAPPPWRLP